MLWEADGPTSSAALVPLNETGTPIAPIESSRYYLEAYTSSGSGSTDAFTHDDLLSGDMRVNGASQSPADFLAEAAASCEP